MNKEHVFPEWLIRRTGTDKTGIRWGKVKSMPALSATLPLCKECNSAFGAQLESPTAALFSRLESGGGLSDHDFELLIRWMWKIQGLSWIATHPNDRYTDLYTLRERVLSPIDSIRPRLVFGIALVAGLHPESRDYPMGIDAVTQVDAVFVSGVFLRIAMMVVIDRFAELVPAQFLKYRLAERRSSLLSGRLIHPPTSFRDDVEAVGVTAIASRALSQAHDVWALQLQNTAA